jgi:4-diphosphocytidyl-2-C-methyl-D-erythritol kinase
VAYRAVEACIWPYHWTFNCPKASASRAFALYNHAPVTLIVRSFAKINLGLRIGARRPDGFHELLTVYQTIQLHDLIHIRASRGSGIEVRCQDPRVPLDQSNTCYRVVDKAMSVFGDKKRIVIEIEKRLPVQGGLGGASSNAVAAMLGLEHVLKKQLTASQRLKIAADVGSDLPLFLIGGTVLGVGRGEQVFPLEDLPAMPCVIVTPEVGVSTPRAFAEWDRTVANRMGRVDAGQKLTSPQASARISVLGRGLSAWLSASYSGAPRKVRSVGGRLGNPLPELVRAGIQNDFEEVVFPEYPEVSEGKKALERAGAKYASVSGSGSTLYGLFDSMTAARLASEKLRKKGWASQATATITRRRYWSRIFD